MATLQAKSIRRREDERLLTGKGNYAADGKRDGMLVAVLVRSPYAHARVRQPSTPRAARGMPGVIGVYTAADLTDVGPIPGGIGFPRPDGGPVAENRPHPARVRPGAFRRRTGGAGGCRNPRRRAWKPRKRCWWTISELPVVTDPIAAMQPGAPAVWDEVP